MLTAGMIRVSVPTGAIGCYLYSISTRWDEALGREVESYSARSFTWRDGTVRKFSSQSDFRYFAAAMNGRTGPRPRLEP